MGGSPGVRQRRWYAAQHLTAALAIVEAELEASQEGRLVCIAESAREPSWHCNDIAVNGPIEGEGAHAFVLQQVLQVSPAELVPDTGPIVDL